MVKSKAQLDLINKFRKNREQKNCIFNINMKNTTELPIIAEILSNKSGFSEYNRVDGYNEVEISSWIGDGLSGDPKVFGIVYDEARGQMVISRRSGSSPYSEFKQYTIDNSTNVATLVSTVSFIGSWSGEVYTMYSPFNDYHYIIGTLTTSTKLVLMGRQPSLGGVSVYNEIIPTSSILRGMGIIESNGYIYVTNAFDNKVYVHDPILNTNISTTTIPVANSGFVLGCIKYIPESDKYFITATGEVFVMDGTTNVVTLIHSQPVSYGYSSVAYMNGVVVTLGRNTDGKAILTKWDINSNSIISQRVLNKSIVGTGGNINFWTDSFSNIYITDLTTAKIYNVYDFNGNWLYTYNVDNRDTALVPQQLYSSGTIPTPVDQRFNPNNNSLYTLGGGSFTGGTVWATKYNYIGGYGGLQLSTSACSVTSATTEFNTEPIAVYHIMMFYSVGGNSYNNLLEYIKNNFTGGYARRVFQPRSFIHSINGDNGIIEIDLRENPLIIDVSHYFRLKINAGEEINMLLFYKQAQKKDILRNKLLL